MSQFILKKNPHTVKFARKRRYNIRFFTENDVVKKKWHLGGEYVGSIEDMLKHCKALALGEEED